jgi:hypothetical protein
VWAVACTDLRAAFVVGDIADPVEPVLDPPVASDPGREGCRSRLMVVGGRAEVDDFDGLLAVACDGPS